MLFGFTEIEAVGAAAAGGGGGGGGGGATFFLHAPSIMRPLSATISRNHFNLCCFTFNPPCETPMISLRSDEVFLFPTPIRLGIASSKSQLLQLGSIGQHGPNLFFARTARLKHNMPPIRRPRRKIIAPTIVRQLDPLLTRNVHQVEVRRSRFTGSVLPNPRKGEKLPVRR